MPLFTRLLGDDIDFTGESRCETGIFEQLGQLGCVHPVDIGCQDIADFINARAFGDQILQRVDHLFKDIIEALDDLIGKLVDAIFNPFILSLSKGQVGCDGALVVICTLPRLPITRFAPVRRP